MLERSSSYEESRQLGRLYTLLQLPELLSSSMRDLESTAYYRAHGRTSFYLDTMGMFEDGPHRFNAYGDSLPRMFPRVSRAEYQALPFFQKARFFGGGMPVCVEISEGPTFARVAVMASGGHSMSAPIVILRRGQEPTGVPAAQPAPSMKTLAREA